MRLDNAVVRVGGQYFDAAMLAGVKQRWTANDLQLPHADSSHIRQEMDIVMQLLAYHVPFGLVSRRAVGSMFDLRRQWQSVGDFSDYSFRLIAAEPISIESPHCLVLTDLQTPLPGFVITAPGITAYISPTERLRVEVVSQPGSVWADRPLQWAHGIDQRLTAWNMAG